MSLPLTGLSTSRLTLFLGAFVMIVGTAFGSALPALAHDQVVSASPGENESLATAPTEVVIEFTADLLDTGALINVTNASGDDVTKGEIRLEERTVTQPLQPDLPDGQYQIVWRVVSSDGHPITDKYQFAIGEPVEPMVDATDAPAADQSVNTSATDGEATQVATASVAADPMDINWGRVATVSILGAFAGVTLYAAITALLRRTNINRNV